MREAVESPFALLFFCVGGWSLLCFRPCRDFGFIFSAFLSKSWSQSLASKVPFFSLPMVWSSVLKLNWCHGMILQLLMLKFRNYVFDREYVNDVACRFHRSYNRGVL